METKTRSQLEFSFTRVLFVPMHGELVGKKKVRLREWFLLETMKAKQYYCDYDNPGEPPTNIICSFCEEGRLQLKKVRPLGNVFDSRHIGNYYQYKCTNMECNAEFFHERIF